MRRKRLAGNEIHEPEAARVAVADGSAVGEMEHDVLVLRRWLLLILELAELERFPVRLIDAEAAGHAEMHHQHLAVVEPASRYLARRSSASTFRPRKRSREVLRQRKAQVAAPLLDARKAVADQDRRKP